MSPRSTVERRCPWAGSDPVYVAYHDREWGEPAHDDRRLYEFLVLESAQAGLSWRTILGKREGYRAAYRGFDPARVARFGRGDVARLLADPAIVRNRAKIESSIVNARAFLAIQHEFGSFAAWLWSHVEGRPVVGRWRTLAEVPSRSALGDAIAQELKAQGFRFLGPTTVYAYLQAVGITNDHLVTCFRWRQLAGRHPPVTSS